MKKEDLYSAKSIGLGAGSEAKKLNEAKDHIRIQTLGSLALLKLPPEWLNEYPLVIERDGKFYLRNSREWVKLTHLAVKHKYNIAVSENNEEEANRLMEGLVYLNKYLTSLPHKPSKANRKPLMWYVARLAIWADINYLGGIRPYHSGAILALAEKYGVDYDGNVYQEGW